MVAALSLLAGCSGGSNVDCSYAACGGDPTGEWEIEGLCRMSAVENPLADTCPEASFSGSMSMRGTADFRSDGSYASETTTVTVISFTIPAECLELSQEPITDCSQLEGFFDAGNCSGNVATSCSCSVREEENDSVAAGTWTTNDTELSLDSGTGVPVTGSYCVEGTTMKFEQSDIDGEKFLIVLGR
jgi:hypothetical protein